MVSKISQLSRKKKKFNIGGVELEFEALGLDELQQFNFDPDASMVEQTKETMGFLKYCLKKADPEATEKELGEVSLEHMDALQKAIFEVNNMGDKSNPDKVKNMLAKRKANLESNTKA